MVNTRKTRKRSGKKKGAKKSLAASFKMIRKDIMKKLEKDMKANIKYSQKLFRDKLGKDNVPKEGVIRDMLLSMLNSTNQSLQKGGNKLLTGFTPLTTVNNPNMPAGDYNEVIKAHQQYDHPSPPEAVCGGAPEVNIDSPANQVPVSNDGNFPGANTPNLYMVGGDREEMEEDRECDYKRTMARIKSQKGGALSFFPVNIDTNARFPGITDPTDPILGFTSKVTQNIDSIQNLVDGETVLNNDVANSGYMGISDKSSTFAAKDIQMLNTPLIKISNVEVEPDVDAAD